MSEETERDAFRLPFAPVTEAGLRAMLAEAEEREQIVGDAAGRYSVPAYHALRRANELAQALYLRRLPRVVPPGSTAEHDKAARPHSDE